jgi:hypothetical protein
MRSPIEGSFPTHHGVTEQLALAATATVTR